MNMNPQDIFLGLDSPQTHRVVSISASQSLHASTAYASPGAISTGLRRLDEALSSPSSSSSSLSLTSTSLSGLSCGKLPKGVPCGYVTEVFGPPGVGKTSLALSTAVNALRDGGKVVWIDTGSPLPTPRLKKMLLKSISPSSPSASTTETILETLTQNLIYIHTPSLPHLLALLFHPPKHFPPAKTTLLVIDSVSGPFPSYYPNPTELKSRLISQNRIPGKSQIQWLMNRKWNVTSDLANQVMKIAATHRLAVFLVNQTQTRIKGQPRPILSPALAGGVWEGSVHARIVLYRDLLAEGDAQGFGRSSSKTRFAEVMKRGGKALSVRVDENIIPFCIERDGLGEIIKDLQPTAISVSPPKLPQEESDDRSIVPVATRRKRKVDEIADSQDEDDEEEEDDSDGDYGWIDGDDAGLLGENNT